MKNLTRVILSAAALLSAAPLASAHEYDKGSLHIAHPWARPTSGESRVGAAYFEIQNRGQQDDMLVSVTSPGAGAAEIHAIIKNADVLKMRKVDDGVKLPGDATVKFEPGGLHIMLFDLKQPLKEGDSVPMTLSFAKAGKVDVEVKIENPKNAASDKPEGHHHHH